LSGDGTAASLARGGLGRPGPSESNPLRLAAYGLHPVGFVLEWVAMRPLHFLVSNPQLERIFGHVPHESPFGGYEPYQPDSE